MVVMMMLINTQCHDGCDDDDDDGCDDDDDQYPVFSPGLTIQQAERTGVEPESETAFTSAPCLAIAIITDDGNDDDDDDPPLHHHHDNITSTTL